MPRIEKDYRGRGVEEAQAVGWCATEVRRARLRVVSKVGAA
jgi:hypothetical protein